MSSLEYKEMDQATLERLIRIVHRLTGISLSPQKKTLLEGRIRPRMRALKLVTYADYAAYLGEREDEIQQFINLITTNETYFFRTQRVWDYFLGEYLPAVGGGGRSRTLRIWSAAASTGEEAYTIGICCEEFRLKNPSFDYQIVGTDISTDVLKVAEKGEYGARSFHGFREANKALFDRYFVPSEGSSRISDKIRPKVRFKAQNLLQPCAGCSGFDIVFLRNVMIYFEQAEQERVLSNISKGMVDRGILIIGESESLSRLQTDFRFKSPLVYEKSQEPR